MDSSGVTRTSAPRARARLAQSRIREALPATSPTVQLICAIAMRMRRTIAFGSSNAPCAPNTPSKSPIRSARYHPRNGTAWPARIRSFRTRSCTRCTKAAAASADSGWAPRYLLLREGGTLAAALPLYLKSHSYGEYVFDWAWADA